jgi:large subunit ribosomal protein L5
MEKTMETKKNIAQTPREFLEKIVIDVGVGRLSQNSQFEDKGLPQVMRDVALLAGQQPQVRKARKSISGFKLREGQTVGLRITLRRQKMVDFFERLIRIVLPRVRDFIGLDTHTVDGGGVLNVGLKEHSVFPEINQEQSPVIFSLGISIVPKEKNREEALEAYRRFGVPFKRVKNSK